MVLLYIKDIMLGCRDFSCPLMHIFLYHCLICFLKLFFDIFLGAIKLWLNLKIVELWRILDRYFLNCFYPSMLLFFYLRSIHWGHVFKGKLKKRLGFPSIGWSFRFVVLKSWFGDLAESLNMLKVDSWLIFLKCSLNNSRTFINFDFVNDLC